MRCYCAGWHLCPLFAPSPSLLPKASGKISVQGGLAFRAALGQLRIAVMLELSYSSSKHLIIAEGEMRKGKPLGVAPYRVIWNVPVDRLRSATFKLRL